MSTQISYNDLYNGTFQTAKETFTKDAESWDSDALRKHATEIQAYFQQNPTAEEQCALLTKQYQQCIEAIIQDNTAWANLKEVYTSTKENIQKMLVSMATMQALLDVIIQKRGQSGEVVDDYKKFLDTKASELGKSYDDLVHKEDILQQRIEKIQQSTIQRQAKKLLQNAKTPQITPIFLSEDREETDDEDENEGENVRNIGTIDARSIIQAIRKTYAERNQYKEQVRLLQGKLEESAVREEEQKNTIQTLQGEIERLQGYREVLLSGPSFSQVLDICPEYKSWLESLTNTKKIRLLLHLHKYTIKDGKIEENFMRNIIKATHDNEQKNK